MELEIRRLALATKKATVPVAEKAKKHIQKSPILVQEARFMMYNKKASFRVFGYADCASYRNGQTNLWICLTESILACFRAAAAGKQN